MDTRALFGAETPVVGMVHLPALPDAPGYDRSDGRDRLRAAAERDATRLVEGGVDAVMVENFGDAPFYPAAVPKHVVAEMTDIVGAVRASVDCAVGVNVLRNDAIAALSVAAAAGASFIRVNVHVGARVTDQGLIEGQAHETLRYRDRIDASDVRILADVAVKHSSPVGESEPIEQAVAETLDRGLADGIIVSGTGTGSAVDRADLERAVRIRDELGSDAPILVGSGVTPENVGDLLDVGDGVIVGTALKRSGQVTNPVDTDRVTDVMDAVERVR